MHYKICARTLLLVPFLFSTAFGVAGNNPPWPDPVLPPSNAMVLPEAPHKFLDRRNKVSLVLFGGLVAADGVTTQHNLANHAQELNPVARPLVQRGWAGQLGASALGYGGSLALSYMFHRKGHHKLERIVLRLAIGAEAAMVTNNLARSRAQ